MRFDWIKMRMNQEKRIIDSGGIRTHASMRLVPKTSALDHSATLPRFSRRPSPHLPALLLLGGTSNG